MRLNKLDKKGRGWTPAAADEKAKPKFVSTEVVVGRVSSDMIATSFAPKIAELALESLEKYADEVMWFDDLMREFEAANPARSVEEGEEVEVAHGPFAGMKGIVTRLLSGEQRVQLLMEVLGRTNQVEVPAANLKTKKLVREVLAQGETLR